MNQQKTFPKPIALLCLLLVAAIIGLTVASRFQDGGAEFKQSADKIHQATCKADPKTEGCN